MQLSDKIKEYVRPVTDRKGKYRQVDDEQTAALHSDKWQDVPIYGASNPNQSNAVQALWKESPVVLLFTSAVVFAIALLLHGFIKVYIPIDRACTERFSPWAPMIEAVSYEWTQYDSVNLDLDYAGPPTWERESNWPQQYDYGFLTYPYDKIDRLNKSTDGNWWVHDRNLITLTEWAHQVHCTWLLREWIYRDQFDYSEFTNITETRFHIHKDHCLLVLKTMIECKADATPVLFGKDPSGLGAWRIYDAPKKCRRNEDLAAYIEDNMICDMECEPADLETA